MDGELAGAWVAECARVIAANRNYLTALDAAIGDADHGANMDRGFRAAAGRIAAARPPDAGEVLRLTGLSLLSEVGGASGPLFGTFFVQVGGALGGTAGLGVEAWAEALEAGVEAVAFRGGAERGDKTMLDALLAARDALGEAAAVGADADVALAASAAAAGEGMRATIPMLARRGLAAALGEASLGHQDPGATSAYLLLKAAADVWA